MDIKLSRVFYLLVVIGGPLVVAFFCQTLVPERLQLALLVLAFAVSLFFATKDRDRRGFTFGSLSLFLFYIWTLLDQNMAFSNVLTSSMARSWLIIFGCTLGISLILGNARKQEWMSFLWDAMLVIGLFYAVITIVCWLIPGFHDVIYRRFFSGLQTVVESSDWKAGFTNHYSTNAMYITLGLVACIPLILKKRLSAVLRYGALVLLLVALLLTTKRTHLVSGVASVGFALCLYGSRQKLSTSFKVIVVAIIALVGIYASSLYVPDLLGVFERFSGMQDSTSVNDRNTFQALCLDLWSQSPIVGNGLGSFAINFNMTGLSARYIAQGHTIMSAHNCFWQVLAEEGAVGFVLMVLTFAAFLCGSIRLLLKLNRLAADDHHMRAYLSASIALQLFFVMYCVTGNPLYDMQTYVPYLFSCGVYLAIRRVAVESGVLEQWYVRSARIGSHRMYGDRVRV